MKNTIDLILPCYNPPLHWQKNLLTNMDWLHKAAPDIQFHVILVNDGSANPIDKSSIALLQETVAQFTYISYPINQGKGHAIRKGMQRSEAAYAIFTDIDFPFLNEDLLRMAKCLVDKKPDLLIGSRNESYYRQTPAFRKYLSMTLKKVVQFIFNLPCNDTQCGLKGFSNKGRDLLLLTTINRYLFDIELLILAGKNKTMRIQSIEVSLKEHVIFTNIKLLHLLQESKNLISLWLKK